MYRHKPETGFLSILYAIGPKPLQTWEISVKNGHVKRVTDDDIQSQALEIIGANVNNSYISCPQDQKAVLGTHLPKIVLQVKHLRKYFCFDVTVLDDKKIKRKFKATNFQAYTRVRVNSCSIPMKLVDGWNQVHIDLDDFTQRAFGTNYVETLRVQIHATCRLRRVYFTDQPLISSKIPPEFKVFAAVEEDGSLEKTLRMGSGIVKEENEDDKDSFR